MKKILKNKKIIFLGLLILLSTFYFFLFSILPVLAQIKFTPQIPIPGMPEIKEVDEWTLAIYVSSFYQWSVTAIAIIAVVIIMISGIQWILAAGNPPAIQKAREQMMSAIIGLVLVLLAIPILRMINPALVARRTFKVPRIVSIVQACKDLPETDWQGLLGREIIVESKDDLDCGEEYEYPSGVKDKYNVCYGHRCYWGGVCFPPERLDIAKCILPGYACVGSPPGNCEKINSALKSEGIEGYLCRKWRGLVGGGCSRIGDPTATWWQTALSWVPLFGGGIKLLGLDCCIYSPPLRCEDGWTQVKCSEDTACWNTLAKAPKNCGKVHKAICTDPGQDANYADGICCKKNNTSTYKCHTGGDLPEKLYGKWINCPGPECN